MKVSEENYVEYMKCGNEKGLQYFIEHHGWIVKSIVCKKLSGYDSEQEECMNDVFLAIWENVRSYDSNKAAFTTWVAAVTKYRTLNYLRKIHNKTWELDIETEQPIGSFDIETEIDTLEDEEMFKRLLEDLSQEDQEIFKKLFWDELSYEDISEEMHMSKSRLYNRISKGKKKIRKTIERGNKYGQYI